MLPGLRSWLATAAIVGTLVVVGVWAHDLRGVGLGLVVLLSRLAMAARSRLSRATPAGEPGPGAAPGPGPGPAARKPGAVSRALEAVAAAALLIGMAWGGVLAWQTSPGVLSAITGALVAGVLLLVTLGVLACVGGIGYAAWDRLRRMG